MDHRQRGPGQGPEDERSGRSRRPGAHDHGAAPVTAGSPTSCSAANSAHPGARQSLPGPGLVGSVRPREFDWGLPACAVGVSPHFARCASVAKRSDCSVVTTPATAGARLDTDAVGSTGRSAQAPAGRRSPLHIPRRQASPGWHRSIAAQGRAPVKGLIAFRITQAKPYPVRLRPPFQQVLVQSSKPVPGRIYNICYVAVKNGTRRTFTAANDFSVKLNNSARSKGFPVLTGSQEWKPNQWIVFYVLTQKYYPVSFVGGGFEFDFGGVSSTAVPGPSSIYLRLKYNPATFAQRLNWIVAYGQGAQLGAGSGTRPSRHGDQ